jgi:DNA-binding beta-propeller fold protein YncE
LLLSTSIYDDPSSTRFVVIDTRTLRVIKRIAITGAFAFDALSPDGKRLYLTQHPNGFNGPIRYVVRSLSLATGQLEAGAIVDKTEPGEQMAGLPMARAWSLDGGSAYTLYNGLESHAFVHALDTVNRNARCIDLPWRGDAQGGLERTRMAVGKDGVLVLSLPGVGVLARIDTRTFKVEVVNDPR